MNAHELVFMVNEMGMTPSESIAAATINPARLLRRDEQLGSIELGKFADIVAVRADPFDAIEPITSVHWVMKGGRVYRDDAA